jgi:phosphatidate cytidylyltransferase
MIILLVVVQPHFIATNIFQGLVWLVLPHTMIVCNDIMAYFVGITIGHKFVERPLTKLSPNKTWEGFVGAAVLTLGYALLVRCSEPWISIALTLIVIFLFPDHRRPR